MRHTCATPARAHRYFTVVSLARRLTLTSVVLIFSDPAEMLVFTLLVSTLLLVVEREAQPYLKPQTSMSVYILQVDSRCAFDPRISHVLPSLAVASGPVHPRYAAYRCGFDVEHQSDRHWNGASPPQLCAHPGGRHRCTRDRQARERASKGSWEAHPESQQFILHRHPGRAGVTAGGAGRDGDHVPKLAH